MVLMSAILSEIKVFTPTFIANSNDLVDKASEHSITYNRLPDEQKRFLDGVMTLSLFICYDTDDGDDMNAYD